jgi:hypothetical protein
MLKYCPCPVGRMWNKNRNVKVVNISIENVLKFKYLGSDTKLLHSRQLKEQVKFGELFGHLDQNLSSSRLLCKSIRINIPGSVIWPRFSRGCEKRLLIPRKEHRLRCSRTGC